MKAMFQDYKTPEDYIRDGIKFLTPMTALEIEDVEEQDKLFNDDNYYVEEKLDGTRGHLFIFEDHARLFSRHISVKTNWFTENTDSVPHIRDLENCQGSILYKQSLSGTVLDGEMYIPNRPFKDVSATLNCKWDEAVKRQETLGKICMRVFDIRYFKGIKVENMPLHRRKEYLKRAVEQLASPYVVEHEYYDNLIPMTEEMEDVIENRRESNFEEKYPSLYEDYYHLGSASLIRKRSYYEYLCMIDCEGVILKNKFGKYHEKRGKEYLKIKKYITRDVIVTGYGEPTKEYTGKFPKDFWSYWVKPSDGVMPETRYEAYQGKSAKSLVESGYTPVTHTWFNNQIGTIKFGVCISAKEVAELPNNKKYEFVKPTNNINDTIIIVGECSGFDDETREKFSKEKDWYIGTVIEVKANEVFKDTGKMRHPRYLRMRWDKNKKDCTWKNHTHTSPEYTIKD